MKTTFRIETFEQARERGLERARKLDRRERIEPERTFSFESPHDMLEVLTRERMRLCEVARGKHLSISALAAELQRDVSSVRSDIRKLQHYGLVRVREQVNNGHGRVRIVEPVAKRFVLLAEF
jgi:predicted transcriptional regulator